MRCLFRSIVVAALATVGGASASPALATDLPRIASMNVCTDQLLIPLADPEQILGLSRYARDAWQSFWAEDARRYPNPVGRRRGCAGAPSRYRRRQPVRQALDAGAPESAGASPRRICGAARTSTKRRPRSREMGEIVRHTDRAAAEVARLDAAVARARQAVTDKHYSVLPLSRRGWVSGSDSLVGSLLSETGLFNAASDLGVGTRRFSLAGSDRERKAGFSPGVGGRRSRRGRGQRLLLHPALERFYPPPKRIVIRNG